jgi:hypothetical protein
VLVGLAQVSAQHCDTCFVCDRTIVCAIDKMDCETGFVCLPGRCFHLFLRAELPRIAAQQEPEILRAPLAPLALRIMALLARPSSSSSFAGDRPTVQDMFSWLLDPPPTPVRNHAAYGLYGAAG